jgi:hypothetical protein
MPRRLLLLAGWSATAMVAMVGPAACWSLMTRLVEGDDLGISGIATWVLGLFYGSWLLWAIAAGAATRSYQLRTARVASGYHSVADPLELVRNDASVAIGHHWHRT